MKKALFTVLLLLFTAVSFAQVYGTVTNANGDPLVGATVFELGTTNGTVTDLDGKFILNVAELPTTIEATYIGFASKQLPVSSDSESYSIQLSEDATLLDEVVVTGLASSVKRRNSANSVAVVKAEDLTGTTAQPTMDGALYGKFTGAELRSSSGAPGGGMSVRLRGVTSIFGDQQPLYIIDGVYLDNKSISSGVNIVSQAAGGGSQSVQDDASNRIADIDPEDIESIEVLKGASAAAIYGSRAAGGVVIITTKRGQQGKPRVSVGQDLGWAQPVRLLGDRGWDAAKVESVFGADERARFEQNEYHDYEKELFDNRPLQRTTRLEVSGGSPKTTYFMGGSLINNGGLVENTGYDKKSIRFNISQDLFDWLEVDVSTNYINSSSDRGFFNNSNSNSTTGYALAFTRPWDELAADENGIFPANSRVGSNALETVSQVTNRENTQRFLGSLNATASLYKTDKQQLQFIARGGLDNYNHQTTSIFPSSLSYFRNPNSLQGVSISGKSANTNTNMAGFLVHTFYAPKSIIFVTQAGLTQEDFDLDSVIATGTGLNGSQTNVNQSANTAIQQTKIPQRDRGVVVQEEMNFDDKIVATFGFRADKSTNNGDADKFYFYPKANFAVNFAEFAGFESQTFDQLKARVAYGESGRFSGFNDRFNLYTATFIGENSGFLSSATRGNTEVGPERQKELEFGIDFAAIDNRLTFEGTYYIKTIEDLLLRAQTKPSTGYTRQVINGGELRNNGVELALNASPLASDSPLKWNSGLRWWKNKSEITSLAVPAFNLGGFAASLGQYRIEEGSSATQIVGTYNPADCGTPDCSDFDPEGDGFRVYGDAEADFNMSWNNSLSYNGFDLNFLWHWKKGGDGINLSTLLYDLGGTTWDYDEKSLDPTGTLGNGDYRTTEWFAGNSSPWIEDQSYIRLREVGLFYQLPKSTISELGIERIKFGVSGRNLINIFDYNSYDPEVSNFGNNVLANTVEVVPFPSNKMVNFHIKGTF